MPRWVAFLRAINVGGHVVKMERLRSILDSLGFANVETFIASGNVIFEARASSAARLEEKIQTALRKELGYDVATFLRNETELDEIADYEPFSPAALKESGAALYIAFLPALLTAETEKRLLPFRKANVDLVAHGREIYCSFRVPLSDSGFSGARLEKAIGFPMTMRNANTVARIVAKLRAKAT
jgi:uncharacterized protein (DUF1697 family)